MLKSMRKKLANAGRTPTQKEADPQTSSSLSKTSAPGVLSRAPQQAGSRDGPSPSKPAMPVHSEESRRAVYAESLGALRDASASDKSTLFVKKLHLCAFAFDFADPGKDIKEKELKRQTLIELVDYVSNGPGRFNEAVSEDVIYMISCNLFRSLPPSRNSGEGDTFDPDEEEPVLDPSWPHLQVGSHRCAHRVCMHRAVSPAALASHTLPCTPPPPPSSSRQLQQP